MQQFAKIEASGWLCLVFLTVLTVGMNEGLSGQELANEFHAVLQPFYDLVDDSEAQDFKTKPFSERIITSRKYAVQSPHFDMEIADCLLNLDAIEWDNERKSWKCRRGNINHIRKDVDRCGDDAAGMLRHLHYLRTLTEAEKVASKMWVCSDPLQLILNKILRMESNPSTSTLSWQQVLKARLAIDGFYQLLYSAMKKKRNSPTR